MKLNKNALLKMVHRATEKYLNENCVCISVELGDEIYGVNHQITIATHEKYTIADLEFYWNGYHHHFFGISAKHPKDQDNEYKGISLAVRDATYKMLDKFAEPDFSDSCINISENDKDDFLEFVSNLGTCTCECCEK